MIKQIFCRVFFALATFFALFSSLWRSFFSHFNYKLCTFYLRVRAEKGRGITASRTLAAGPFESCLFNGGAKPIRLDFETPISGFFSIYCCRKLACRRAQALFRLYARFFWPLCIRVKYIQDRKYAYPPCI